MALCSVEDVRIREQDPLKQGLKPIRAGYPEYL